MLEGDGVSLAIPLSAWKIHKCALRMDLCHLFPPLLEVGQHHSILTLDTAALTNDVVLYPSYYLSFFQPRNSPFHTPSPIHFPWIISCNSLYLLFLTKWPKGSCLMYFFNKWFLSLQSFALIFIHWCHSQSKKFMTFYDKNTFQTHLPFLLEPVLRFTIECRMVKPGIHSTVQCSASNS